MYGLSNSKKAKVLHRIYTVIKYIDQNAEIKRDDLHTIYEVNKYSIRIKFNQNQTRILKNKMIDKLCSDFDLYITDQMTEDKENQAFYSNKENLITISVREQDMNYFGQDELLIDVVVL